MGIIKNISFLDARKATEESLKHIIKIENVALLICTEETAKLLDPIHKSNVASFVKIPNDLELEFINMNGNGKIDDTLLEGIQEKAYVLINGQCLVKEINPELFKEKIYALDVNGELYCPRTLKGLILTKGSINGPILDYKEGFKPLGHTLYLTENNILRYSHEKLCVNKLIAIEPIVEDFEAYINKIQIQEQVYITKSNLKRMRHMLDEFDEVDVCIVPEHSIYLEGKVCLNPENITDYDDATLVVDGMVHMEDLTEDALKEHIQGIYSEGIYCDKSLINTARTLSMNQASVRTELPNTIYNVGKLVINEAYLLGLSEKKHIENMGKLKFDDSVNPELVVEKISSIENLGKLVGNASVLSQIDINNLGVMKMSEEDYKEKEQENEIYYENLSKLIL